MVTSKGIVTLVVPYHPFAYKKKEEEEGGHAPWLAKFKSFSRIFHCPKNKTRSKLKDPLMMRG